MSYSTELNVSTIVGPTHFYGGLSYGNIKSLKNKNLDSNPKIAALQCLEKIEVLHKLGIPQAILPPQERPDMSLLRQLGFTGDDKNVLACAANEDTNLLINVSSASSMWTANSATVTPSIDSQDNKVHLTPANLVNTFHRSIEVTMTQTLLKKLFFNESVFFHHSPLPNTPSLSDEGAANHSRFCIQHGDKGIHLFVYGKYGFGSSKMRKYLPMKYPARQSFEASTSISRSHKIAQEQVVFAQQSPTAIDAGVFHNDVISTGNENLFIYHENSFVNTDKTIGEIRRRYKTLTNEEPYLLKILNKDLSINDAVKTYLFNCQIVTLPQKGMIIIAPEECRSNSSTHSILNEIVKDIACPVSEVHYINLRQSMKNGGGPACLRLRVPLTSNEFNSVNPNMIVTDSLITKLKAWTHKHYRNNLVFDDLSDASFLMEVRSALDELTQVFKVGSIYSFQSV